MVDRNAFPDTTDRVMRRATGTAHERRKKVNMYKEAKAGGKRGLSSKGIVHFKAHVVDKGQGSIKLVHPPIAGHEAPVGEMANVTRRVVPRADRAARAAEAGLRAEGGVFAEGLAVVVGRDQEHELAVSQEAAGRVDGLEGDAVALGQAGADGPRGRLLERAVAGRRNDLRVDGGARVRQVARVVARRGDLQRDGRAGREGSAARQGRRGIASGHDVGLHLVLRLVAGVARGHHALVEGALRAVAVVAADAEDDGALLAHGVVATDRRPRARVEGVEGAFGGVASADRPPAQTVSTRRGRGGAGAGEHSLVRTALDDGGDEAMGDGRVGILLASALAGEQAVLEISHDPRSAAGARSPGGAVAEVDGLHVAVARVVAVQLGVSIVEAAHAVVMRAVEDGIPTGPPPSAPRLPATRRRPFAPAEGDLHALGLVARREDRIVVAIARPRRDEHAVRRRVLHLHRRARGAGKVVEAVLLRTAEASRGRLVQVGAVAGLVVDDGDQARRLLAELVLLGRVGDAARRRGPDARRAPVRGASDLVQGAGEAVEEGARRAVRGDARRLAGGVDVALDADGQPWSARSLANVNINNVREPQPRRGDWQQTGPRRARRGVRELVGVKTCWQRAEGGLARAELESTMAMGGQERDVWTGLCLAVPQRCSYTVPFTRREGQTSIPTPKENLEVGRPPSPCKSQGGGK